VFASVLKERITNLRLDREEILQKEAIITRRIDQLVQKRNKLNAFRSFLDGADYGVLTVPEDVFSQHLAVQVRIVKPA
jgi:hypothetical protein